MRLLNLELVRMVVRDTLEHSILKDRPIHTKTLGYYIPQRDCDALTAAILSKLQEKMTSES